MRLLTFLIRNSRTLFTLTLVSGIVSGGASAWLIALVNGLLKQSHDPGPAVTLYLGVVGLLIIASYFTRRVLLLLARDAVNGLRLGVCQTIAEAPLVSLEREGRSRLIATLTEDILVVSDTLAVLPVVCIETAVIFACFVLLAALHPTLCLGLALLFVCGIVAHTLISRRTQPYLNQGRDKWDELVALYHDLVDGNKELKLDATSKYRFWTQQLRPTALDLQDVSLKWHNIFAMAGVFGQVFYFLALGLVLFVGPLVGCNDPAVLGTFSFMAIYLAGPIGVIVDTVPKYRRACVALQRIEDLGFLGEERRGLFAEEPVARVETCRRLSVENLCFEYVNSESGTMPFIVGPISAEFRAGEISFVVGPNGSGKSSLVKLLCGLYPANSGTIRLDDRSSEEMSAQGFRDHFAVVFSDFHLFSKHHGIAPHQEERARKYLRPLGLEGKVDVANGRFSSIKLSAGQRKRLALLIALVQDRPIYIFDEWASDQDPKFRDFFYHDLIRELKMRGKIVVVVSHDRPYFAVADKLVGLTNGVLDEARSPRESESAYVSHP